MKTLFHLIQKLFFWAIITFFFLLVALVVWLKSTSPGTTPDITDLNGKTISSSVSEIKYIDVNQTSQYLLIRGFDTLNPVLLMIHGGPGSPQVYLDKKFNSELEKHFIVVNWDQRGAGASYDENIPDSSFTIDQFIEDTKVVSEYLKNRFHKEKIFILGHSWGSYLGINTVYQYPELYYAYIGIGQVSDQQKSELESYRFVLEQARKQQNKKAIEQLESLGAPINGSYTNNIKDIPKQRRWVNEYGGAAYGKNHIEVGKEFMFPLLTFQSYTINDKINYIRGLTKTQQLLWEQMTNRQVSEKIDSLKVPVFILHGKHDYQTVYSESQKFFEKLEAPKKKFYSFENSAHLLPYNNEKERFHQIMIQDVLPVAK